MRTQGTAKGTAPGRLRRAAALLACTLGLGGAALGLVRCFSPDLPACAYICNTAEPRCPDEYECRADSYCHLRGSTEACSYSMDLAPAVDMLVAPDQSVPPDLATPADLSMPPDLTGSDLL